MGGTRGSAIPYIVMNDLAKFEFEFNKKKFEEHAPIFKSITESIQDNENENEKLTQLLSTLLPKLISGEIDEENFNVNINKRAKRASMTEEEKKEFSARMNGSK